MCINIGGYTPTMDQNSKIRFSLYDIYYCRLKRCCSQLNTTTPTINSAKLPKLIRFPNTINLFVTRYVDSQHPMALGLLFNQDFDQVFDKKIMNLIFFCCEPYYTSLIFYIILAQPSAGCTFLRFIRN